MYRWSVMERLFWHWPNSRGPCDLVMWSVKIGQKRAPHTSQWKHCKLTPSLIGYLRTAVMERQLATNEWRQGPHPAKSMLLISHRTQGHWQSKQAGGPRTTRLDPERRQAWQRHWSRSCLSPVPDETRQSFQPTTIQHRLKILDSWTDGAKHGRPKSSRVEVD